MAGSEKAHGIKLFFQLGNYFIMDSEQLVSNPFQELMQDAVAETQKKSSMTERLTSVKNNVCENHFSIEKSRLERQKTSKLKQLHDHSNRLRHEVKLLDLDRQRREIEIKKRVEPEKDYSYDDMQIVNTERRLGANIASFYLDKKLKYPTRLRSVSDITITPTIRRARQSLRQHDLERSLHEENQHNQYQGRLQQDRVQTAKTMSSSCTTSMSPAGGQGGIKFRRNSRSAPLYMGGRQRNMGGTTTLPVLVKPSTATRAGGVDTQSIPEQKTKSAPQPHVKFTFENPLQILASSEESAKLFARTHNYYPGMTRALHHPSHDSDDSDDESSEIIDLRTLLFKDDADTLSMMQGPQTMSHAQIAALRKAQGPPPKLTTDMMQVENEYITSKISKFLHELDSPKKKRRGSDSSDEGPQPPTGLQQQQQPTGSNVTFQVKTTSSTGVSTSNNNNNIINPSANPNNNPSNPLTSNTKSTSTTDLYRESTSTGQAVTNPVYNPSIIINPDPGLGEEDEEAEDGDHEGETSPRKKYSWEHIRGRKPKGSQWRSDDLVLQALTGVPIRNALHTHVPLHSASRAMRHTATFKMRKVVERLIQERTKYERHQVEELKRQMAGDGPGELAMSPNNNLTPTQSQQPSRRVSKISII